MSDFRFHPSIDRVDAVHSLREKLVTVMTGAASILSDTFTSRPAGDALALLFAGLASVNGVTTIFSLLSGRYGDFAREGGLAFYLFHLCGYVAVGYGITAYFALSWGGVPDENGKGHEAYSADTAVAYGILPMLLFQARALGEGYFDRLAGGKKNWIMTSTIGGSALICSLMLAGGRVIEKNMCGKFMSAGLFLRGLIWIAFPGKTEKLLYKVDISEREREAAKAVGVELGQNLLTYASLIGPLSCGVAPLRAIGFSSLVHAILLLYNSAFSRLFANDKASPIPGRIYLSVSAFFACALFLSVPFRSHNVLHSVSMPL